MLFSTPPWNQYAIVKNASIKNVEQRPVFGVIIDDFEQKFAQWDAS